jgi:hypothetical protein
MKTDESTVGGVISERTLFDTPLNISHFPEEEG